MISTIKNILNSVREVRRLKAEITANDKDIQRLKNELDLINDLKQLNMQRYTDCIGLN